MNINKAIILLLCAILLLATLSCAEEQEEQKDFLQNKKQFNKTNQNNDDNYDNNNNNSGQANAKGTGERSDTFIYNEELAYSGATILTPQGGSTTYLVDMNGEVLESWEFGWSPFTKVNSDATLIAIVNAGSRPDYAADSGAQYTHMSWDGEVLWEYQDDYIHHDVVLLPNGNVMGIMWEEVSEENKEIIGMSIEEAWTDKIIEIDYDTKEIIWELSLQEVLDLEKHATDPDAKDKEWLHTNAVEYLPEGNAFNGEEAVMLSFRNLDTVVIISKETKEILWESPQGMFEVQHNPTLTSDGNILVFDNRNKVDGSRAVEVNPNTDEIVWEYESKGFYSGHISGAQRLENGNTLICEGEGGRIFEVTEEKEIVWEFNHQLSEENERASVFRAYRYDADDVDWPDDFSCDAC